MKLLIKTENDTLKSMYTNNQFYNPGDSGLDLFCPETITIQPGIFIQDHQLLKHH
jgi:hypothetical protein